MDKPFAINHVVNLRRKMEPPLPECSLGNIISIAGAVFTTKEKELSELVSQLREAIKKLDIDFLEKIKSGGEDGFSKLYDAMKEVRDLYTSPVFGSEALEFAGFNSWCNFGIYDIDFGWGKPIWATGFAPPVDDSNMPHFNFVFLMDRRTDKGVEALVGLNEDDFNFLEKDTELLQFASINPSLVFN
ncbi:hypothetical protein JCGZ_08104 [Jatropha curcas]|uniref:Uncharacterized protein n=1 Tax=Jatropha curcas TaxID=180498 RepID=A0A067KP99_JATCU|nr:hypothetical protein JCGZ_08104 [Jatropha curcas]